MAVETLHANTIVSSTNLANVIDATYIDEGVPPAIVTDNLLREYRFDDGSGTQLTDYSGNAHHGTLGTSTGAPTWTSSGLSFDGGDYVTIPGTGLPTGNNSVSVCAAFKLDSNPSSQGAVGYGNANTGGSFIQIACNGGVFYFTANTNASITPTGGATSKAFFASIRYDSALVNTANISTTGQSNTANPTAPNFINTYAWIGCQPWPAPSGFWIGSIYFVSFHTKKLTDDELTQMYQYCQYWMTLRGITV